VPDAASREIAGMAGAGRRARAFFLLRQGRRPEGESVSAVPDRRLSGWAGGEVVVMTITFIEDRATHEGRAPAAAPPGESAREDASRRTAPVDPATPTATDADGLYRAVFCCTY
jgi:hypothetical protein